MTPHIAVVVPNRNDSRYLPRCLRSILEQQPPAAEVVVVDDQSTDDSIAVIERLIAGHANARLVKNPVNLGVNGAINEGVRHTRASHVVVIAANDFVLPGIFGAAQACFERAPQAGLWSALGWLVDLEDRPIRLHPSPLVALSDAYLPPEKCIELALRHGNWFTGTTMIFRRDALDEAGGFDADYMGMADLFTALAVSSRHGAAYSPAPYAAVRIHPNNYLTRTLSDAGALEGMLQKIVAHGRERAPRLFTPRFVERTLRRFRAASVRTTGGATLGAVAGRSIGWTAGALRAIDALPASWRRARVMASFVVLRPFDLLPTLWNRAFGWLYVRSRARWPGT